MARSKVSCTSWPGWLIQMRQRAVNQRQRIAQVGLGAAPSPSDRPAVAPPSILSGWFMKCLV